MKYSFLLFRKNSNKMFSNLKTAAGDLVGSVFSGGPKTDGPVYLRHTNGLEGPHYEVTKTTENYEIRSYQPQLWTSVKITDEMTYDKAVTKGFWKLFNYIAGKNNETKTKVEMTAPVMTRVVPGQGPACESEFTISFYVPDMYQKPENPPPKPTEGVHNETLPQMTVAVGSYGGYTKEATIIEQAAKLQEHLKKDGVEFEENRWVSAGYDSPFRLANRHNEVWMYVK